MLDEGSVSMLLGGQHALEEFAVMVRCQSFQLEFGVSHIDVVSRFLAFLHELLLS